MRSPGFANFSNIVVGRRSVKERKMNGHPRAENELIYVSVSKCMCDYCEHFNGPLNLHNAFGARPFATLACIIMFASFFGAK